MLSRLVVAASVTGLLLAGPLEAQRAKPLGSQPVFGITPYAGDMFFGDFLKGPIGTSLSNASGPLYGGQLSLTLARNVALVGNVAHASSNLQIGLPLIGAVNVGTTDVWLYDGDLQFSAPLGERTGLPITPFIQVGAGGIHYNIQNAILNTTANNFELNAGLGTDIRLSRSLGLRLMAKDYVGKFNFQEATHTDLSGRWAQNWALTAGINLNF